MEEPDAQLARARALLDVHRYDDAVALLGTAVAGAPEDYRLQVTLARALLLAGREVDAAEVAERAARLSPTEAEPHCIGAEASLEHGWFPRADQAAMRACALEPDNPRAQFILVRTRLALGELDDARVAADRVLELQPFGALGHHARGLVFLRRQEWPEAEAEYRAALVMSPNDANLLNNCGLAVMNQHREKEAVELFTRAGAIDARRDVFRKNTAIAARRHIGDFLHIPSQLQIMRAAGPFAWLAIALLVIVVASESALVVEVALGVLAVAIALALVSRRRRIGQLPQAARIAIEIDTEQRKADTDAARPRRAVVAGSAAFVAVVIALSVSHPWSGDDSNRPIISPLQGGTLAPDYCRVVSSDPDQRVIIGPMCPDPSTTSTTVDPFAP